MRFKIILFSGIIAILGFLGFYTNSYCSDPSYLFGNDVLNGLNGSANINSLLGDTYSFESLYSPGFVVGISNAYDSINDQLYDRFGWDLDDVGNKIIEVTSGDEIGLTLNVLAGTIDSPALDILANGYQVFRFARSGGGQSLVLGVVDNVSNTVSKIKGNILSRVTTDDIDNIYESIETEVSTGGILDASIQNFLYSNEITGKYNNGNIVQGYIKLDTPLIMFCPTTYLGNPNSNGNSEHYIYVVYPSNTLNDYHIIDGFIIGTSGTKYNISSWASDANVQYSTFDIGNTTYVVRSLTIVYTGAYSGFATISNSEYFGNLEDIKDYISDTGWGASVASYVTKANTSNWAAIRSLLDSLKGAWVSSEDMATVADVLDGGVVIPNDVTGELEYDIDASIVAELTDIIQDILDKSDAITLELDDVIDDSLPDTPDPEEPVDYTGILVPDNFPTGITDPILDLFDFNFNLFSFFEPLFYIFGTFTGIYALWSFVPLAIIIVFVIWVLK